MKRFFLVALAVIGTAAVSSAATLTITADQATYGVGDPITLTVTGDPAGASASGIFGALVLSGSGGATGTGASQTQITSFGGALSWTLGSTGGAQNVAFDQIAGLGALPGDITNPLSTLTFSADSVGVVNFDWNTDVGGGYGLNFLTAEQNLSKTDRDFAASVFPWLRRVDDCPDCFLAAFHFRHEGQFQRFVAHDDPRRFRWPTYERGNFPHDWE